MCLRVDLGHDLQNPSHDVHQSLVGCPKMQLRLLAVGKNSIKGLKLESCEGRLIQAAKESPQALAVADDELAILFDLVLHNAPEPSPCTLVFRAPCRGQEGSQAGKHHGTELLEVHITMLGQ